MSLGAQFWDNTLHRATTPAATAAAETTHGKNELLCCWSGTGTIAMENRIFMSFMISPILWDSSSCGGKLGGEINHQMRE